MKSNWRECSRPIDCYSNAFSPKLQTWSHSEKKNITKATTHSVSIKWTRSPVSVYPSLQMLIGDQQFPAINNQNIERSICLLGKFPHTECAMYMHGTINRNDTFLLLLPLCVKQAICYANFNFTVFVWLNTYLWLLASVNRLLPRKYIIGS